MQVEEKWDIIVKPKTKFFDLNLKEVWKYKDLIVLLVKRDLTAVYKQTILGPMWMFVQPLFSTIIYTITFGQANLTTDGIPALLFYLTGLTFWGYFSDCLNKTSNTFIANASIFGKVYFPRLVIPISIIFSNLIKLGIQIILLTICYVYFYVTKDGIHFKLSLILLIPYFIMLLGVFGLSLGILFSSVTTKYRDFSFLLTFAVQLLMFLSCVVFPLNMFSGFLKSIIMFNPVANCLEGIKYILTGHGFFSIYSIIIPTIITLVLFIFSILLFNKTEKSFMDTV